MGARERVLRVLAAASRLRDESDSYHRELMERLPSEIGWSPTSVSNALRFCVETQASDDELVSLLASVPEERVVHVVLSSNVFVAAVRAIALAWASAPVVRVKPSRREPIFPEVLLRAIHEQDGEGGEGEITIVDSLCVGKNEAVHVYGSDRTIQQICANLSHETRVWGHGHGFGILVADRLLLQQALADDLNLLEQRGCLSPRILIWIGEEEGAQTQAFRALELFSERDPGDLAARRLYIETMHAVGEVFQRGSWGVGVQYDPHSVLLPPEPGMLHVVQVPSMERARELLVPWGRWVTSIGGEAHLTEQIGREIPWARRALPGYMQRPSLDGPVDRRTQAPRR